VNKARALKGLYAITDSGLASDGGIVAQVELALRGGVRAIQYRNKHPDPRQRAEEAAALLRLCRTAGVPLIINDDVALAAAIQADGVHLGMDDPDPRDARRMLGPGAIIGMSCYNRLELAFQAQAADADYVAFGRFFPSSIKPLAVQADIELLARARAALELPIIAIGGITPENGGPLIAAGADMLAVIHGIFGQPDILRACQDFNKLFANTEVSHP
jgi:thiamine-phosphate pyrophosphorylase